MSTNKEETPKVVSEEKKEEVQKVELEQRQVGKSDLTVTTLGFGCWQFGSTGKDDYWGLDYTQDMCDAMIKLATDSGILYLDTAEDYGSGLSESRLGKAVQALDGDTKKKVIIGSKIPPNHTSEVEKHCLATLERLQVDCIDLYMVHWPIDLNSISHFASGTASFGASSPELVKEIPPVEKAFTDLKALQAAGKIKHIGVSNFGVTQLKEALATGVKIAVNQCCYNLLFRALELDIMPFCEKEGIGIIAYMPLMQGLLNGMYDNLEQVPNMRTRSRHFDGARAKSRHGEKGHEALTFKTIAAIKKISEEEKIPMTHLALAYPLSKKNVACVIAGATKERHIASNVAGVSLKLSPEVLAKLDKATDELKEAMGGNCDLWQGGKTSRIN